MPDQNNQQFDPSQSPIFNLNSFGSSEKNIEQYLRIISQAILRNPDVLNIKQQAPKQSQSAYSDSKWTIGKRNAQQGYRSSGNIVDDFERGLRDGLLDALAGGDFKKGVEGALKTFTDELGMNLFQVSHEVGKTMVKRLIGDTTSKQISSQLGNLGNQALNLIFRGNGKDAQAARQFFQKVGQNFFKNANPGSVPNAPTGAPVNPANEPAAGQVIDASEAQNIVTTDITEASQGAAESIEAVGAQAETTTTQIANMSQSTVQAGEVVAETGEVVAGTGSVITAIADALIAVAPYIAIAVVAFMALEPAIEGTTALLLSLGKSALRSEDLRRKAAEEGRKRLKADMEYIAREPFEILKKAAEEWYTVWDNNLRTIGQTQGYDKEAVYALYEGYASKLRSEGLGSVISATDIANKLSTVLATGLSGEVAEEFAYIATKLNAAIPTQDFFGYADSYASIAANAIAQGKTQQEALAEANAELEQFASNLLYSSRELAGGFSTGLKDSATLFKDAVQIAQTAKTYNASDISGTLTSVSAIIGAVAPDLASSLVDNVVQAAIGGNNNSSLVALRSLANINAGNTEFLRAMAEDPQSVFSAIFTNLANMQNMSPDNYMEVAEGLADVFGIDKAAFARVDFNYLAQAISAMNVNNSSLEDNLNLLISGQTTTTAEQLKMQEINSIILEEGLAYVIDSEAGRMIQQHMWDEQIAIQMQNATYAIDVQGDALKFLEGIRETITNILYFLNPMGTIASGVTNLVATLAESIGNTEDVYEILTSGAVGSNVDSLFGLTTYGQDLKLTSSLVEMMGGTKGLNALNWWQNTALAKGISPVTDFISSTVLWGEAFNNPANANNPFISSPLGKYINGKKTILTAADMLLNSPISKSSRYAWGSVGKSTYAATQGNSLNTALIGAIPSLASSATQNAYNTSTKMIQEFLDSAAEAAKTMSVDAWLETASNFGISDIMSVIEDFGLTEEKVRGYFEANQAREGAIKEESRKEDEQLFRDENREFWDYAGGSSGVFQTAMWLPFFGEGMKYDSRMDAVDSALSEIQSRIGVAETFTVISGLEDITTKIGDVGNYTVISGIEQIHNDLSTTFVSTSSLFQRCLRDWIRYIDESTSYKESVSKAQAWSDFKAAEADQQTQATLALANALSVFSADELKKMDPQLQTNALLGEIVIILQAIMQQNNNVGGGMSLIDSISAMSMGLTNNTQ